MGTGKRTDSSSYQPFDIEHPEQYNLVLCLGAGQGAALITSTSDDSEGELIELESVSIPSLADRFSSISKDFNSVDILFDQPLVTIVPEGLFEMEQSERYLKSIFPADIDEAVSIRSQTLDAYWVFSLDASLQEELLTLFPQAGFNHVCTPIVESLLRKNEMQDGRNQMHLHLSRNHAFIFVFTGDSLALFNPLINKQATDLVYEAVFAIDRLNIKKNETTFSFSGDTEHTQEAEELIKRYLPDIGPLLPWSDLSNDGWDERLLNKHLPIFDSTLCAS